MVTAVFPAVLFEAGKTGRPPKSTTEKNLMSKIDEVYRALVRAPDGMDADVGEVLCAIGRMASALLSVSSSDAEDCKLRTDWFCQAVTVGAKRSPGANTRH